MFQFLRKLWSKRKKRLKLPPLEKGYAYRGTTVICQECCSNCGCCGKQGAIKRQQQAADEAVAKYRSQFGDEPTIF